MSPKTRSCARCRAASRSASSPWPRTESFFPRGRARNKRKPNSTRWWPGGKPAEVVAKYAKKGTLVLVRGRLRTRNWADKTYWEIKHYKTEIVMDFFEWDSNRPNSQT